LSPAIAAVAVILLSCSGAHAQTYPDRPVKIIVPFTPGGATDVLGRLLGERLQQQLGQPFVVENRGGAAGMIGSDAAAKSAPDGYTLLVGSNANAIYPAVKANVPYDLEQDLEPLCQLISIPNFLIVGPNSPYKTLRDLIADAKANPGKVTFASTGVGTSLHLAGELLKVVEKIEITHIPYKGSGPAVIDLIPGRVSMMFDNSTLEMIRSGQLRALAVSSAKRSPLAPDIPTLSEAGFPGYAWVSWYGMFTRKGTPEATVELLRKRIADVFAEPAVKERVAALGGQADVICGAEFTQHIHNEVVRWAKIAQEAKVPKE
jgi:tripartite-type tricarboxylate transporter receptor subunit TctC